MESLLLYPSPQSTFSVLHSLLGFLVFLGVQVLVVSDAILNNGIVASVRICLTIRSPVFIIGLSALRTRVGV